MHARFIYVSYSQALVVFVQKGLYATTVHDVCELQLQSVKRLVSQSCIVWDHV